MAKRNLNQERKIIKSNTSLGIFFANNMRLVNNWQCTKSFKREVANWRPLPLLSWSLSPPLLYQASGGDSASDQESRGKGRQLAGSSLKHEMNLVKR